MSQFNLLEQSVNCSVVSYSFATPWTVAPQTPLSLELSRQEYWSGLPFPSPEDLTNPGFDPRSSSLQADSLLSEPPGKSRETEFHKFVERFKT